MPDKRYELIMKTLLLDNDGRILMLRRSLDSKSAAGKWDLPGGKVESGEDFAECLKREVAEETELNIEVDGVETAFQGEGQNRVFVYLVMRGRVKSGTLRLSGEHSDFMWVPLSELASLDASEHFRVFFKNYRRSSKSRKPL